MNASFPGVVAEDQNSELSLAVAQFTDLVFSYVIAGVGVRRSIRKHDSHRDSLNRLNDRLADLKPERWKTAVGRLREYGAVNSGRWSR